MEINLNKEKDTLVKDQSDDLFNVVMSLSKQYNLPEPSFDDYTNEQSYSLNEEKKINVKILEQVFSVLSKHKKLNK